MSKDEVGEFVCEVKISFSGFRILHVEVQQSYFRTTLIGERRLIPIHASKSCESDTHLNTAGRTALYLLPNPWGNLDSNPLAASLCSISFVTFSQIAFLPLEFPGY